MTLSLALTLLALQLSQSGSVEGFVLRAGGEPVAGARVVLAEVTSARIRYHGPNSILTRAPGLSPEETQRVTRQLATGESGQFRAEGLAPGEYTLVAAHPTAGLATMTLRLSEDGNARRTNVLLQPPAYVLLDARHPAGGATLTFSLAPRATRLNLELDPHFDGAAAPGMRTLGLPPVIEWDVLFEAGRGEAGGSWLAAREPVDAHPGEETRVNLALDAGWKLSGRVMGPEGQPFPGIAVLGRSNSIPARVRGGVTDAHGRFVLSGMKQGTWTLSASEPAPGLERSPCEVAAVEWEGSHSALLTLGDVEGLELRVTRLAAPAALGAPAPELGLFALDGTKIEFSKLRGRPVVLLFWDAHCDAALALLPRLEKLRAERAGEFALVAVELGGDSALVRRTALALPWTHGCELTRDAAESARRYGVRALPDLRLIAADGTLDSAHSDLASLRARLEALARAR